MIPKIISFSFGQTSGYMLWRLKQEYGSDFAKHFIAVFCNTGKEHDKTLEFGHKVETEWGVEIVWLEYDRIEATAIQACKVPEGRKRANLIKLQAQGANANWFKVVDFNSAARNGDKNTPFDKLLDWTAALPNVRTRFCSSELKTRVLRKWLSFGGVDQFDDYVGIRKDEEHRCLEVLANAPELRRNPFFPLVDWKVTKKDVDDFWNSQPFKLEIPNFMGNCDMCFLKARWKRIAIAKKNPEVAAWWEQWEDRFNTKGVTGDGARFISGKSIRSIINEAQHPEFDLDTSEQDIPCSCATGRLSPDMEDEKCSV